MMNVRATILTLLLWTACLPALAQTDTLRRLGPFYDEAAAVSDLRYCPRATMIGIGPTNLLDTYLSPEKYHGIELRIVHEDIRGTRLLHRRVTMQNMIQGYIGTAKNRADNNKTLSGLVSWNLSLHYNLALTPRFRLLFGPSVEADLGYTYNLRNGNNPATLRAFANLGGSGMAVYDLPVGKKDLVLRYQLQLPLIGIMFSPHYGQSYYEIFSLGNDSGTCCFTTIGSQPSARHLVSADYPLWGAKIRLAYMWDVQQSKVNELKTHYYSHTFFVGVVKDLYIHKHK